jgi:hypothetical protein
MCPEKTAPVRCICEFAKESKIAAPFELKKMLGCGPKTCECGDGTEINPLETMTQIVAGVSPQKKR